MNTKDKQPKEEFIYWNDEWNSAADCALENNINQYTLRVKLSGNYKNNTTFKYV